MVEGLKVILELLDSRRQKSIRSLVVEGLNVILEPLDSRR